MAAVTLNVNNINPTNHEATERLTFVAAEAITAGQAVYMLANGTVGVAAANTSGKKQFLGIALKSAGAGYAVGVQMRGLISGFNVSGLNAGVLVYLSDTAGVIADAAGTLSVPAGRVYALADSAKTKVVYIHGNQLTVYT